MDSFDAANLSILFPLFVATHLCIHRVHYYLLGHKEVGLRICVTLFLWEAFLSVCCATDKPAVHVILDFMFVSIEENKALFQGRLYPVAPIHFSRSRYR